MRNGEIKTYKVGYCKHPEFMVLKGGRFKSIEFPAMVAQIQHSEGNLLIDTGYGEHFHTATKTFPEKLYALATPICLDVPLYRKLEQQVSDIFITHFHADHISGLKDFPEVRFICSKVAYELSKNESISRFKMTKKGLLPSLLPDNFLQRTVFIEDLSLVDLPKKMEPFTKAYQLFSDMFFIDLPGHAAGHYGLLFKDYFFIGDAVWDMRTIKEDRLPNKMTHLLTENTTEYYQTIKMLQKLHVNNSDLKILPTHCTQTWEEYFPGSTDGT